MKPLYIRHALIDPPNSEWETDCAIRPSLGWDRQTMNTSDAHLTDPDGEGGGCTYGNIPRRGGEGTDVLAEKAAEGGEKIGVTREG
mmetsp:Transcript_8662/g.19452  ORF Transcript_8662/g.19452 Transcript_8662/m.19452 type:complete len:86 (-) Transcript_8662:327-584(-)